MKNLFMALTLFSTVALAGQTWTMHKAEGGKYERWYIDDPEEPWTVDDQKQWDSDVENAITQACDEAAVIQSGKNTIARQTEISKVSHTQDNNALQHAGALIVDHTQMRQNIIKLLQQDGHVTFKDSMCQEEPN